MQKHLLFLDFPQHLTLFVRVPLDIVGCIGDAGKPYNQTQSDKQYTAEIFRPHENCSRFDWI
jgi:hypothetical protein